MKFLFFDLELALSIGENTRICEFGYVVTDDKFNVIESGNECINPNQPNHTWKHIGKYFGGLTRDKEFYKTKPIFKNVYQKIKKLFDSCNIVIGWSIKNDVLALNNELVRYNLPSINYKFIDAAYVYEKIKNVSHTRLSLACTNLGLEPKTPDHDAYVDAYNTMLCFKKCLELNKLDIFGVIRKFPNCRSSNFNYWIVQDWEHFDRTLDEFVNHLNGEDNNLMYSGSINFKRFKEFVINVKPQEEKFTNKLNGIKINISYQYLKYHFNQALNLVQLITNNGGIYTNDIMNETNIYVKAKDIKSEDIKFEKEILGRLDTFPSKPQTIEFSELLSILSITEKELDLMQRPKFSFLFDDSTRYVDLKEKKAIKFLKAEKELKCLNQYNGNVMLKILRKMKYK